VVTQTHALKNIDVTAYYEILDNPLFGLDFGFTARLLRADLGLTAGAMSASRELSVTLPMLFVDAEMAIWGTDTHVFMQGNYSRYQSDRNYDWRGGIAWRVIDVALLQTYLRAGWQHTVVNINDRDHLDLHTDNDGGFVGIAIDF
jgi:outer membrane protein